METTSSAVEEPSVLSSPHRDRLRTGFIESSKSIPKFFKMVWRDLTKVFEKNFKVFQNSMEGSD